MKPHIQKDPHMTKMAWFGLFSLLFVLTFAISYQALEWNACRSSGGTIAHCLHEAIR